MRKKEIEQYSERRLKLTFSSAAFVFPFLGPVWFGLVAMVVVWGCHTIITCLLTAALLQEQVASEFSLELCITPHRFLISEPLRTVFDKATALSCSVASAPQQPPR
jgi:hypothetical protein